MSDALEKSATTPVPLNPKGFNPNAKLPNGCTVEAVKGAMGDFLSFLSLAITSENCSRVPYVLRHSATVIRHRAAKDSPLLIPTARTGADVGKLSFRIPATTCPASLNQPNDFAPKLQSSLHDGLENELAAARVS